MVPRYAHTVGACRLACTHCGCTSVSGHFEFVRYRAVAGTDVHPEWVHAERRSPTVWVGERTTPWKEMPSWASAKPQ